MLYDAPIRVITIHITKYREYIQKVESLRLGQPVFSYHVNENRTGVCRTDKKTFKILES